MTLRSDIKQKARLAMDGSWNQGRLILLIILGLGFCINMLDASIFGLLGYRFEFFGINSFAYSSNFFYDPLALLLSLSVWAIRLIILTPLACGMVNWYRQMTDRKRMGVTHIFWVYETKAWLRASLLAVSVGIRLAAFSALLLAVPFLLLWYSGNYLHLPVVSSALWAGGIVLGLVGGAVVLIFSKRYSMATMLLGEQYNMTARQAVRTSVRYTKGHCAELFVVDLSFIPWLMPLLLLCFAMFASLTFAYDPFSVMPLFFSISIVLVGVITLFKVQPYYTMTTVMYSRYLYECATCVGKTTADTNVEWDDLPEQSFPDYAAQHEPEQGAGVRWQDIPD